MLRAVFKKKISSNKTLKVHHFQWYSLLETMQLLSIRAKEYVFQHREVKMKKKMARKRIELMTSALLARRSNQLS